MKQLHDIPLDTFTTIEQFLKEEMSAEDTKLFRQRMAGDKILQEQVEELKLLFLGVQEAALAAKLTEFHSDLSQQKPPSTTKLMSPKVKSINNVQLRKWLVAASVLVVAGAGLALFLTGKNEYQKMYATYYRVDPGLITSMSSSDNFDFDKAMVDYKTGDYDAALEAWRKLLTDNPTSDTLNYFIGSAFLAKGDTESAVDYFQKVLELPDSIFRGDAYWYKGLSLLEQGKTQEAMTCIEQSDHPRKELLLLRLNK